MAVPHRPVCSTGGLELLDALLFDFDGTLVDTRGTSWPLFVYTNREFGLGIETREQYFALFETNLYDGLVRHCQDADRGKAAATHFMTLVREHYDPPFVPGIAELVRECAARFTLAIVSSNTRVTIDRLLEREHLTACFETVIAGDVEPSKTRAIVRFLGAEDGRACRPDAVVLVSDTSGDMAEAHAAGIGAYGVAWGMHTPAKLLAAGAMGVADRPEDLRQWIDQQAEHTEGGIRCPVAP